VIRELIGRDGVI